VRARATPNYELTTSSRHPDRGVRQTPCHQSRRGSFRRNRENGGGGDPRATQGAWARGQCPRSCRKTPSGCATVWGIVRPSGWISESKAQAVSMTLDALQQYRQVRPVKALPNKKGLLRLFPVFDDAAKPVPCRAGICHVLQLRARTKLVQAVDIRLIRAAARILACVCPVCQAPVSV